MLTAATLAERLGAASPGACTDVELQALSLPWRARHGDVTFIAPGIGAHAAMLSAASAVLTSAAGEDARALVVPDVALACARAHAWLPVRRETPDTAGGIAASAVIRPGALVEEGAVIGHETTIERGAVVAAGARIGDYCRIGAGCIIESAAEIGNRVTLGAACVIGGSGFSFVRDGRQWLRLPCFGTARIEDDATLLSQVTVHAGVFSDTVVGRRSALDSQVLIGHDVVIGADTAIAGHAAVAGGARIGSRCRIGGKAGISEGVVIADDVTVTAMSMVIRSLPQAGGSYSSGWPAEQSSRWWRRVATVKQWRETLRRAR